jgi:hypothetical protein
MYLLRWEKSYYNSSLSLDIVDALLIRVQIQDALDSIFGTISEVRIYNFIRERDRLFYFYS